MYTPKFKKGDILAVNDADGCSVIEVLDLDPVDSQYEIVFRMLMNEPRTQSKPFWFSCYGLDGEGWELESSWMARKQFQADLESLLND